MLISKTFKWDAAHRLPKHQAKCRHLHGHTYTMTVEFEGNINDEGMVIDFGEIRKILTPYIDQLDHTTIICKDDTELLEIFQQKAWRHFLLPYDSTAENLCRYFSTLLIQNHQHFLRENGITAIGIKIYETETSCAYLHTQVEV